MQRYVYRRTYIDYYASSRNWRLKSIKIKEYLRFKNENSVITRDSINEVKLKVKHCLTEDNHVHQEKIHEDSIQNTLYFLRGPTTL